ncbi:uncharacterized protein LOC111908976 [Lactuca sativa]|uniref:uncharacterized protein LOC111908976 n=1 Tax=Lactuca sativa TaxID=4236 RepID=UPI000CD8EE74|nr:uncharacterized protein LOC111908976 [Lactuca sativa]
MIELFEDRYVALIEVVVAAATTIIIDARIREERSFQYWDFDNKKPPEFYTVKGPIVTIRWLSNTEGSFFTCSCLDDQKAKCALNLLCSGANIGGNWLLALTLMSRGVAVTWERFSNMLCMKYLPLVERERLTKEYLDMRQSTEMVTKITKIFIARTLFCPEFSASKQDQMIRYFSILKTDIRQFVSTQRYDTLAELQEAARRQ